MPAGEATLKTRTLYGDVHVLHRVSKVPPYAALIVYAISVAIAGTPERRSPLSRTCAR